MYNFVLSRQNRVGPKKKLSVRLAENDINNISKAYSFSRRVLVETSFIFRFNQWWMSSSVRCDTWQLKHFSVFTLWLLPSSKCQHKLFLINSFCDYQKITVENILSSLSDFNSYQSTVLAFMSTLYKTLLRVLRGLTVKKCTY